MKVKLKAGEKLLSMNNYCGLDMETWTKLNQGKQVELDVIPDNIKDKIEGGSSSSSKDYSTSNSSPA